MITTETLGYIHGVSQTGRLGVAIDFASIGADDLSRLRKALRANGHRVWTTRTK